MASLSGPRKLWLTRRGSIAGLPQAKRRADAREPADRLGAGAALRPAETGGAIVAQHDSAVRHRRHRVEKIRHEFHRFRKVHAAKARRAAMLMHVHVKQAYVLSAAVVGALHRLADRARPHHRADPPVVEIVVVLDRVIVGGENDDTAAGETA